MFRQTCSLRPEEPQVYVMANDPAVRHRPSLAFLNIRPADVEETTFQDWAEEPLHEAVVTAVFPAGWRQRPECRFFSRKEPSAPGE